MPLPPGPPLPRLVNTLLFGIAPEALLRPCLRRYGTPLTLRLIGRTLVFFSRPEAVRQLIGSQDPRVGMSRYNQIIEPIVEGDALLLVEGPRHEHLRKLLTRPFRPSSVRAMAGTMAGICATHLERLRPGQKFSAFAFYEHITLEVILSFLLGPLSRPELDRLRAILAPVTNVSLLLLLVPLLREATGPLSPGRRFQRGRERLQATLDALIAERRAALSRGERPEGLLTTLVEALDEGGQPLSDRCVRSQMMTTIVAGHETTAAALSWALPYVLRDAACLGRLREELQTVSAIDALDGLPWLDAICRETLRIQSIFPSIPRSLVQDMEVDGVHLPAGTEVAPLAWYSHRDPQSFPDPERFDPQRFIDKKYSPNVYYPFGGGDRMCLGSAFGLVQMKIALAVTLRDLELEALDRKAPVGSWRQITWIPRGGGRVRVVGRRPASRWT